MKRVAVILSGCGVFDGAEIHESVLTLLAIERQGASYQCFAPDIQQYHVVNHLNGEVVESESRNVLVEAARIARGEIQPLSELNAAEFDALILPGGFGVAKNLCDFAIKGVEADIEPQTLAACLQFAKAQKVVGYLCIAPALMSFIYGEGIKLTIGKDQGTAQSLEAMGAKHMDVEVQQVVVDESHKAVSSPAYMLAQSISEVADSVEALVKQTLSMS